MKSWTSPLLSLRTALQQRQLDVACLSYLRRRQQERLTSPTADTALAKAKVRDAAKAAFDKAVKALQTAEESVIKLQGEVMKTADAQSAAEAAYKREMAMVNAAVNPTTKLSVTPAMDIGQFLDAGEDPAKLKNLTIWLGENWNIEGCHVDDFTKLESILETMKHTVATTIIAKVNEVKVQWEQLYKTVEDSRAKKRRGDVSTATAVPPASFASKQLEKAQADSAALAEAKRISTEAEALKQQTEAARLQKIHDDGLQAKARASDERLEEIASDAARQADERRIKAEAVAEEEAKAAQDLRDAHTTQLPMEQDQDSI